MKFPSFHSILGFQVLLYKGSHIPNSNYIPLIHQLQERLHDVNATVSIREYSFFSRNEMTEDTILIGHSFGGYFALLDTLHDQTRHKHIKGIVLLNSHCNSAKQAWYPSISQQSIQAPLLTVAAGRDRRLPLKKVLPDLWEKKKLRMDKTFYKIYPDFSHFSGVEGKHEKETELLANDIEVFIRDIYAKHPFTNIRQQCLDSETRFSFHDPSERIPFGINYNKSLNFLDALFSILWKQFLWNWIHHILFIMDRPTVHKNIVFTDYGDHILIKSYNMDIDQILTICRDSIPSEYKTKFEIIKVPTNLWGLYQWLLYPLIVKTGVTDDEQIRWPILHLSVRDQINYYKILHPRQIIIKKVEWDSL